MPEIHQALHGYMGGHRLLAASTSLSKDVGHVMVVMSDLSGPPHEQFADGYLTGYSLPADGIYVLARTWSATEISRPGCVWTHSLIFEAVQLANSDDLEMLLGVFRRPAGKQFDSYARPFQLPNGASTFELSKEALLPLITALYSQPLPVLLPTAPTEALEHTVVAVWQHQWPRLRRSFCFCTGALADRSEATGTLFDLQLVPPDRLRRIERDTEYATVGADTSSENAAPTTAQRDLLYLADDIASRSGAGLRKFLTEFGADVAAGRSAYLLLVRAYLSVTTAGHIGDAVDALQSLGPNEAQRLRQAVFGEERPDFALTEYEKIEFLSIAGQVRSSQYAAPSV